MRIEDTEGMFNGISSERMLSMTPQERRWLDNIKKGVYYSDLAIMRDEAGDGCLQELFKAIDTAKSLRRSLRGDDTSGKFNRDRFIEFLGLEIPAARPDKQRLELHDRRSGKTVELTLGEILYDIRCMVHENENLNAAEEIDYHILLDWSTRTPTYAAVRRNGVTIWNGYVIANRLREVVIKFIQIIEAHESLAAGKGFSMNSRVPLGSIKPERKDRAG